MQFLRAAWAHPSFRAGFQEMATVSPGIAAWGLVTGVAMVNGGLSVPLALFMSLTVFAGSAQLAAVPLMVAGAPLWVIAFTAFCVNLRFVIFSVQWRPYLQKLPGAQRLGLGYLSADLTYVLFMKRYMPGGPAHGQGGQLAYFAGASAMNYGAWQIPSIVGILLADVIPLSWGLGFAGVLALVGVMLSLVQDRATALSAGVAATAAVAAFALPFKLFIVVAISAAVCAGLIWEQLGRGTVGPSVPVDKARRP